MSTPSPSALPTMTEDDYAFHLQVHASPEQVITALTDDASILGWWTAATRSERRGDDVALFSSDGRNFVSFAIDHAPGTTEVRWTVLECVLDDWLGTQPTFSLRPNEDGTCTVDFLHHGLGPALPCFEDCRAGWNHFMPSLHQFLETGVGRPNEPRDPSA